MRAKALAMAERMEQIEKKRRDQEVTQHLAQALRPQPGPPPPPPPLPRGTSDVGRPKPCSTARPALL
eukprot:4776355-Prymnesium_polylepis.1